MSVSRDFIDSYSPEARNLRNPQSRNRNRRRGLRPKESRRGPDQPALWQHNVSFRFLYCPGFTQGVDILAPDRCLPSSGPGRPSGGRWRRVAAVDAPGPETCPVGTEPDQLLHVRIGRPFMHPCSTGLRPNLNFVFTRVVNHCVTVCGTRRASSPGQNGGARPYEPAVAGS